MRQPRPRPLAPVVLVGLEHELDAGVHPDEAIRTESDAQRMQGALDDILGSKTDVPQGGVIWVFAVKR